MYISIFDMYLALALAFLAGVFTLAAALIHYVVFKHVTTNARHKAEPLHTMDKTVDLQHIQEAIAS